MTPKPSPGLNEFIDPAPARNLPDTVDITGNWQAAPTTEPSATSPPGNWPDIPGYSITGEIARGGMGRVLSARETTLQREVAIKVLLPGANADRFVTESRITARLPHPNIPPVYALGTLDDGSPYLAMKLIRGRTLAELLNERTSPKDDLSRFVPIFEQISQAVGFAHSQGMIHRDLKPLNVMVGSFGEVQVMDWGLAKDLASPELDNTSSSPSSAPMESTSAGAIMGTPGYMAPEQARGEVVDARADVFALGATLAAILTGKPAFVGSTGRETITKAAGADLTDVFTRLEASGADAGLLVLAKHCLAAKAEDRPADAREVAVQVAAYRADVEQRLRQAQTAAAEALVRESEQRKQRRLTLGAGAVVALALLIGLVASLWQMNRAITAEGLAKTNEQSAIASEKQTRKERDAKAVALQAETAARAAERQAREKAMTALRTLTEDIVENQISRGTTLTEENKAFLRMILQQYEEFAKITGDDAESRSIRAEGLAKVGLLRHRLGEFKEAEMALRKALALDQQLAKDFPTRPEFRLELVQSQNNLANLWDATGRGKEAEAGYTDALNVQMQLVEEFPSHPQYRQKLADLHNNLGSLQAGAGRFEEAEASGREAISLLKQLADEFPNQAEYRQELAISQNNLGRLLHHLDRLKDAETMFRSAVAIRKKLAADFPSQPDFRRGLARSYNTLGNLLSATGRPEEAEAVFREALLIGKDLSAEFPTRIEFREELAISLNDLGSVLSETGRQPAAEAAYLEALSLRKQLAADFPARQGFQVALGGSYCNFGSLLSENGKAEESLKWFADAIVALQRVVDRDPQQATAKRFLCNSHTNRAETYDRLGRYAEAIQDWTRAMELGAPGRQPDIRAARANSRVHAGQITEALAEATELAQQPDLKAGQWYDLARIYALAASKDADQKKVHANRAMELLQLAVKSGYENIAQIKKQTDLDALRDREDLQSLITTLEANAKK